MTHATIHYGSVTFMSGRDSEEGTPPREIEGRTSPPSASPSGAEPTVAAEGIEASDPLERTDPRTLEMLVCPVSKATLEYDAARKELISRRANLAYPIHSGVPLLTREAARTLDR